MPAHQSTTVTSVSRSWLRDLALSGATAAVTSFISVRLDALAARSVSFLACRVQLSVACGLYRTQTTSLIFKHSDKRLRRGTGDFGLRRHRAHSRHIMCVYACKDCVRVHSLLCSCHDARRNRKQLYTEEGSAANCHRRPRSCLPAPGPKIQRSTAGYEKAKVQNSTNSHTPLSPLRAVMWVLK